MNYYYSLIVYFQKIPVDYDTKKSKNLTSFESGDDIFLLARYYIVDI